MRQVNQDRIEETIRLKGPLTRPDIARDTGLSLVTVNKSVEVLLGEGKIKKAGLEDSSNSGRRPMLFQINDKLYNYLFAFIYLDRCEIQLSDHRGGTVMREDFSTRDYVEGGFVDVLIQRFEQVIRKYNEAPYRGIFIGVPGVVYDGVIESIPLVPELEGLDLRETLRQHFNLDVYLENDVNLATYGYYYEYGRRAEGTRTFLFLNHGVRMGTRIRGRIYGGSSSFSGEIGAILFPCDTTMSYEERIYLLSQKARFDASAKDALINAITELLIVIQATVNPVEVVLHHELLNEDDLLTMREALVERVGERHAPRLKQFTGAFHDIGMKGMVQVALSLHQDQSLAITRKKEEVNT